MPFDELSAKLMRDVPNLKNASDCREILRVLHRLGDILWFEVKNKDENEDQDKVENKDTNPSNLIILDPKLMLELVREVVNHNYEEQSGESYDALRRDGTLHHSLLMTFPLWKELEAVDSEMVGLFKHLLQHFNLAYPASDEKLDKVDMIVPTYWKTRAAAKEIVKPLAKQQSVLERNNIVGSDIAKWQYSLPVDISEAVYVNFVVKCYRPNVVRKIRATSVECFVRGEFGSIITFDADKSGRCDNIMIEVAAATTEIAWVEMRDFVMAMEDVLRKYPGLKSTKQGKLKRFVIDPTGVPREVNHLMGNTQHEERLRSEISWLPPDFGWFIQRAWTKPGKLDELKVQKITLQLPHRLEVLKQLVVSSETRQFPTLWTLSYSSEAEAPKIVLRIHSDLSGVCHHAPLQITVPNDFLTRHADCIQAGVSVLSVVSSLIPIDIAKTAVETALSASQTALDRAQTVNSILAKAGLTRGEEKSATELAMPVQSRMFFLRELLKLYDPTFDDLMVAEISNLRCAADNETGCYVWGHPRELEDMKGYLTPCDPPKMPMTSAPASKSISSPTPTPILTPIHSPKSTQVSMPKATSISIRVAKLLWTGREKSRKKIYCEWEVVHQSRRADIGKTEEAADLGEDITWLCQSEKLVNVTSITMLQESTVKIFVKQPYRFAKILGLKSDKVIGHGEVHLKDHVGTVCSNSKPVKIEIALAGNKVLQPSTVICEISIVSSAFRNP